MKRVANKAEERSIAWVGALETKRGGETKTRGGGEDVKGPEGNQSSKEK